MRSCSARTQPCQEAGARGGHRAADLLAEVERRAQAQGLARLFVLTTKAPHWFVEHGFVASSIEALPLAKRALYNYQRNSAVLIKPLAPA